MKSYSLSHLADRTLLQALAQLVAQDRATTASLLAHLAEVDERKLYLPATHSSMYSYCVHELHMSEETAYKRIRSARAAREYPEIYPALADGRLHLSAVVLLASHLTPDTADELLTAAAHKTKAEVERLLAERFPQADLPTLVRDLSPATELVGHAAGQLWQLSPGTVAGIVGVPTLPMSPQQVEPSKPQGMAVPSAMGLATEPVGTSRPKLTPLSPGRFALQVTVGQATHEKLRYAQALLGHALPSGDIEAVLERALDALVEKLERQKFAKSVRSRPRHGAPKGRHVPADIRRTVWQRDGGRCTFVSEQGKRCESRTRLEFDHVDPVARGGQASVAQMRLRCRAHNQYAAECTFGAGFMHGKRQDARGRADHARARAQERAQAQEQAQAPTQSQAHSASHLDVAPWLRALGFSAEEARRGIALCAHIPDEPLEGRVRIALRGLAPNCIRRAAPVMSGPA